MSDVELVNADGVTVFRGTQSGGGSQPITVTKYSFPFDFEVGGVPIQNDYLTFATIPAGVVILEVLAFITADWNAGGFLTVRDTVGAFHDNIFRTTAALEDLTASAFPVANDETSIAGNRFINAAHFYGSGATLEVTTDSAAISGNLDLYLLTYTPA